MAGKKTLKKQSKQAAGLSGTESKRAEDEKKPSSKSQGTGGTRSAGGRRVLSGFTPDVQIKVLAITGAFSVAVIAFLVYLPALQNGFVNWDDGLYVYENVRLQTPELRTLKWFFTGFVAGNWHPLTMLSYALDYAIWGLDPKGYHLSSIVLHTFNSALVFILMWWLAVLGPGKGREVKDKLVCTMVFMPFALITALFFALHPVRVESVAWIAERKDVLYGFFYLLGLLSYLRYAAGAVHRKKHFYALTLVLFVFSLMSKPMAISFPFVLLILDFYPLNRSFKASVFKQSLLEKIPFFLIMVASSVIIVMAQKTGDAVKTLDAYPLFTRVLVAFRAYAFYLYKSFVPVDFAPFYPYPKDVSFASPVVLGSIALFLLISIVCLYTLKKTRLWSSLWVYYVITLGPVIGIVQVGSQAAADRYMYLPGLAVAMLFGIFAVFIVSRFSVTEASGAKPPKALFVMVGVLVIVLSLFTLKQIDVWKTPMKLWTHEITLYPDSVAIAYSNRGNLFYDQGKYKRAIEDYDRSLEIDPDAARTVYNKGGAYHYIGQSRRAIELYTKAIELDPKPDEFYFNRGTTYSQIKEYDLAIDDYTKTISISPNHFKAYVNRGNAYVWKGQREEGLKNYARAIKLNPKYAETYANRGLVLLELGKVELAVKDLVKAVKLEPKTARHYNNLGNGFLRLGQKQKANKVFIMAAKLGSKKAQDYLKKEDALRSNRGG